jgi:hypothetical protein
MTAIAKHEMQRQALQGPAVEFTDDAYDAAIRFVRALGIRQAKLDATSEVSELTRTVH